MIHFSQCDIDPRKPFRLACLLCSTILAGIVGTTTASAQQASQGDWNYTLTPYLWGTGLSGTSAVSPALPPVDIDMSFSDILDNLDAGGMIAGNANNGRWGITADLQYTKLGNSNPTPGPAFGSANVKVTQKVYSIAGEYLLRQSSTSELWGAAGARYWSVDVELDLAAGTNPAASARSKNTWVDPIIGVRGRTDVSDNVFLTGWMYAGGFGVGSESSFDLFGAVGYEFTPTTSGVFGYRWISVDREDGAFRYDIDMNGLMAGVRFQF